MTITAYNFSFYDYNMPSQQHQQQYQMDVEWPTADSNTSAYYVDATGENQFNRQCSPHSTQAQENASKYAQKDNYVQQIEAKQQLKPKLNATPKRWSCELREKVLAQAKRSSGSDEDNNEGSNKVEFKSLQTNEHQLKPKLNATPKRWSCELREMVLAQAKRKTSVNEEIPNITVAHKSVENSLNEFMQKSDVAPQSEVALANDMSAPCEESTEAMKQKLPVTVQAKISFFNKLTPSFEPKTYVNNRFLALLKNTNDAAAATIATKAAPTVAGRATKTNTNRWSANLEDLVKPFLNHAQQQSNTVVTTFPSSSTPSFATLLTSKPLDSKSDLNQEMKKNPAYSLWREPRQVSARNNIANGLQRKNSIQRKSSSEKLKGTTSRPNSAGSSGTKIQMHALMEDLSLVMPVRLRIAEYERKISMQS